MRSHARRTMTLGGLAVLWMLLPCPAAAQSTIAGQVTDTTGAVLPTVKLSRPEVGGINVGQGAYLSARGKSSADDAVEIDGLDVRNTNGVSQSGYNNFAMVQDVTYQTSSIGADSEAGGIRIN